MFLDETDIIKSLEDLKKPGEDRKFVARKIGSAADLSGVKSDTRVIDSLFVIAMSEQRKTPGLSKSSCDFAIMEERYAVVYAVSHASSKRNDFLNNANLKEFRTEVRARFKSLIPTGNSHPLTFQSGKMMSYNDTTLWFQDEFTTEYRNA